MAKALALHCLHRRTFIEIIVYTLLFMQAQVNAQYVSNEHLIYDKYMQRMSFVAIYNGKWN